MADIFISYKKENRAAAERIAAGFAADGLEAWWDNDITPREAWDAMIEREIAAASAVVVLWSPLSVRSDWVRTEAHYGQQRGRLVPAMIEPCELPIAFLLNQTVDLTSWSGDRGDGRWRKMLAWIEDLRAVRAEASMTPGAAAPTNRYRQAVGQLASGEPISDGAFVNLATPAGVLFRDASDAPVMRVLRRGEFLIGAPASDPDRANVEGPQKRIEIPSPLAMGVYPVLRRQFDGVMQAGLAPAATPAKAASKSWFSRPAPAPVSTPTADPEAPVNCVSFDEANLYAERLTKALGHIYRLPSEAEWEYACRAGSRSRYAWGDTLGPAQAVCRMEGAPTPQGPQPPGQYAPNAFGLYDMHGDVREWTADFWHDSYDFTPSDGSPALDAHTSMRVVRGGGWADGPSILRSSSRGRATQSIKSDMIGFRLVRMLD